MRKVKNVGTTERRLRMIGGGMAAIIGLFVLLPTPTSFGIGVLGTALVLLGLDFVFTGFTGYCPLYHRLGWDTAHGKSEGLGRGES